MRIAVVNRFDRIMGGVESYLDQLLPALQREGHAVALVHEVAGGFDRPPIAPAARAHRCDVAALGIDGGLSAVRGWKPDVLYTQGLTDPALEERLLDLAPSVFFAHEYYGTCISGAKTYTFPVMRPCPRRFDWTCLVHYYPHRTGGWNPLTMAREYRRQANRMRLLGRYQRIITHSTHMRREYLHQGFPEAFVTAIPYAVRNGGASRRPAAHEPGAPWRLLFVGRMEAIKGGETLLQSLPAIAADLDAPLQVTFVGDGRQRADWEERAREVQVRCPRVTVRFTGWMVGEEVDACFAGADLLVMPSLWPEPFGCVGPEAGRCGVPAVAFAVGGIPEWLEDGVNGILAPGDPPTARGLSRAVVRCLRDPIEHARMGEAAIRISARFTMESHLEALIPVFKTTFMTQAAATDAVLGEDARASDQAAS